MSDCFPVKAVERSLVLSYGGWRADVSVRVIWGLTSWTYKFLRAFNLVRAIMENVRGLVEGIMVLGFLVSLSRARKKNREITIILRFLSAAVKRL